MNYGERLGRLRSLPLVDELLVDTAIKIQLSPTLHDRAVGHYEAIRRQIERAESPLNGWVENFYPQGSMAIGSTIRSRDENDLFDIDLVAELSYPANGPGEALDVLEEAIRGERGSRYYSSVERQTRCVTVYYADMHLDVTPLYRRYDWGEKAGVICHADPEKASHEHKTVPANPWGFANWFQQSTPADDWFRNMVLAKSYAMDRAFRADAASAEPVPDHKDIFRKPMAVVALQLTKRWVQLNFDRRGGKGRRMPSVILSKSFAENAGQTTSLIDELLHQVQQLRALFLPAITKHSLIDVRNPRLWDDHLTDRWPGDLQTQRNFSDDLGIFMAELERAATASSPAEIQKILGRLFGETTVASAVSEFYKRAGQAVSDGAGKVTRGAGVSVAGLSAATANAFTPPKHRFYGD
jgi:hypothetical protein